MKTLLQLTAAFALVAIGAGAAVLSYDVHQISQQARLALHDADMAITHLDMVSMNLYRATNDLPDAINEIQDTARTLKESSQAESIYWNKTSEQTADAARDLRALVARTDRELNDKFLPDIDEQVAQLSTAAQFSFESFTHAGDALTFQINDPSIPQMLESFNKAAASLAGASASANDSLAHVDHTFAYYDKQLTTPLGFWKTLGKTVLSTGSQAGNIYAGFLK